MPSKSVQALEWPVTRPRNWGKPTRAHQLKRPWFGLDTERDALRGTFVCGWEVRDDGRAIRFGGLGDLDPGTHFVWNLAYDVEGLLRDLNVAEGWAARQDGAKFDLMGGKAVYYHGKRFDWQAPRGKISLIEASSYYGRIPLSKIGAKAGISAGKMSWKKYQRDPNYQMAVDEYCIQDARLVMEEILKLNQGMEEIGVTLGGTPGATARRFMRNMGGYPRIIWRTHNTFLQAYCGGRFEIVKRGSFDSGVYQYDIVSAYPWALTKCPWLTDTAVSRRVTELHDSALYGAYEVEFDSDEYLGLAPRWHQGVRVYSAGEDCTWLTKPEMEFLRSRGHEVKVIRGLEVFDENASDLWARTVKEIFAVKRDRKGEPIGRAAKIILNSLYGILIQLTRKSGKWVRMNQAQEPVDFIGNMALEASPEEFFSGQYYAPIYAATLTGLTRVKLIEGALSVGEDNYIGGHTDSILSTKPMRNLSEELGGWKLEEFEPTAEICKTGMYAIGDKVKMRGITRSGDAGMLWRKYHIRNQRCGIKRAKNWNEVSVISRKRVANNFEMERKRKWLGELRGGEWIDSEALKLV